MTKPMFHARKFLNKRGQYEGACILAEVTRGRKAEHSEAYLSVTDCSRKICLDFEFHKKGDRSNALFKLRTLIETLQGFEGAVKEVCKLADEEDGKKS